MASRYVVLNIYIVVLIIYANLECFAVTQTIMNVIVWMCCRSPPLDRHTMEPLMEDMTSTNTMENRHAVLSEPDLVDVSNTHNAAPPQTYPAAVSIAPPRTRPHIYESPTFT